MQNSEWTTQLNRIEPHGKETQFNSMEYIVKRMDGLQKNFEYTFYYSYTDTHTYICTYLMTYPYREEISACHCVAVISKLLRVLKISERFTFKTNFPFIDDNRRNLRNYSKSFNKIE